MADIQAEMRDKLRRTLTQEFARVEDDFDDTRDKRKILTEQLMQAASGVKLIDPDGTTIINDDTDTKLRVVTLALKALNETEAAASKATLLKLKQTEQDIASSAIAKDRIAIILKATAPGAIEQPFPAEALEAQLSEMFDSDIKPFETKTSPKDLDD